MVEGERNHLLSCSYLDIFLPPWPGIWAGWELLAEIVLKRDKKHVEILEIWKYLYSPAPVNYTPILQVDP